MADKVGNVMEKLCKGVFSLFGFEYTKEISAHAKEIKHFFVIFRQPYLQFLFILYDMT